MNEPPKPPAPYAGRAPLAVVPLQPLNLAYAPPARKGSRAIWVIVAGLLTTAAALGGVYALDVNGGEHIMGWYANYIIPAGAMLVGLVASSGYAFVAWKLGVKIRRGLLWTILLLMFFSYFAAEYMEFHAGGPFVIQTGTMQGVQGGSTPTYRPLGFAEYFHLKAVNWTWKKKNSYDKGEPEPLGGAGYFFVILGIVGFAGSGLIIPMTLANKPYCELCERYLTGKLIGMLPASVLAPPDGAPGATGPPGNYLDHLKRLADAGDVNNFVAALPRDKAAAKAAAKLPRRLAVYLVHCQSCASGYLRPVVLTGKGKKIVQVDLPKIELAPDFVREFRRVMSMG